jgi:hypothetical protein
MHAIATLGADDGVGSLNGKPMSVNVDAKGRYWVFQELEPPTVFSATGMVVRAVGRKGSGPGEFRSANNGIAIGDSMLVFDWQERRATMVGPDLKAARTIRMGSGLGAILAVSWPTVLVATGHVPESNPPNSTLHRISLEGAEVRLLGSFGPRGTGGPMGIADVSQHLGWAREGVWSAYWNKPQFMIWDRSGVLRGSFSRRFAWYTGEGKASLGWATAPPTPTTGPIREDVEGLLWLFIHKPAPTWRDAWSARPITVGAGSEYRMRDISYDKLYRTYVEVIDPRTARVVTSHSLEGYVMEALPDRRVVLYRVDENGFPRVQIVALTLSGR